VLLRGSVKVSSTASPSWLAFRSVTATGIGGEGGVGSPGAPQPAAMKSAEKKTLKLAIQKLFHLPVRFLVLHEFRISIFQFRIL
jgi:hypothetical protein